MAGVQLGADGVVVTGHIVKRLGGAFFAEANLKGDAVSPFRPVRSLKGEWVDDAGYFLSGTESDGKRFDGEAFGSRGGVSFVLAKDNHALAPENL